MGSKPLMNAKKGHILALKEEESLSLKYSIPLIIAVNGGKNPPRKVKIREVAALLYKSPQGSNLSQDDVLTDRDIIWR